MVTLKKSYKTDKAAKINITRITYMFSRMETNFQYGKSTVKCSGRNTEKN